MKTINSINDVKTWEDFKVYVKASSAVIKQDMEDAEQVAAIVCAIIERREELGLSQRDLETICGFPQSSIARIETGKIMPKMSTVFKLMRSLGLKLRLTNLNGLFT